MVIPRKWVIFLCLIVGLYACRSEISSTSSSVAIPLSLTQSAPTPVPPEVAQPATTPTPSPVASLSPAKASPTPIFAGQLSPPCGLLLPPLLQPAPADQPAPQVSDTTRAELRAITPAAAWPALQRLLDAPGTVSLVAYQAGREGGGIYLNEATPMPLASVAKLVVLVTYAEAVTAGELNPLEQVTLAELDRYYIPNFDLGAHRRAVAELRTAGRILSPDENPAVLLEDVAWMMSRHSSNAAADYLHLRLGQARIEETVIALGLNNPSESQSQGSHSAPCPFVSQFLMMANHVRETANDRQVLEAFLDGSTEPSAYGLEASLLADAYVNLEAFRQAEQAWRERTRRPSIDTQRFFAGQLAPQGTAENYASLMRRLAQNGLSNGDSSFLARRILEWPNVFPANQEVFSNVGYKNGSLPGVLTTAYYVYRWGDTAPVIVVLFYRDLPQQTYRQWRFDLPHDELARWLLADSAAIPALAAALNDTALP